LRGSVAVKKAVGHDFSYSIKLEDIPEWVSKGANFMGIESEPLGSVASVCDNLCDFEGASGGPFEFLGLSRRVFIGAVREN
jgi:hypothetical protein